jgi:hypothetical protein
VHALLAKERVIVVSPLDLLLGVECIVSGHLLHLALVGMSGHVEAVREKNLGHLNNKFKN